MQKIDKPLSGFGTKPNSMHVRLHVSNRGKTGNVSSGTNRHPGTRAATLVF
jgi:hypothetical protein